jgi:hypothetical protein
VAHEQLQKQGITMPLQSTSGAASYDAFGGGVAAVPKYIEEYFSTFLYAGNNGSQTIVNGVDLATKGGLVWIKDRTQAASHYLQDTVRGANNYLSTNNTNAQASLSLNTVFNTDGFSQNNSYGGFNGSGDNYVSWSIAKAPKFFDVVTFTTASDGSATVSHNLGSTPGCVITKATSTTSRWETWHRSLTSTNYTVALNTTGAEVNNGYWINPSSTQVQFIAGTLTGSQTYVAYLFAHNAGGFGLTGTDNVISCGSFTTDSSGNFTTTLGYEPQWILYKNSGTASNWNIIDNMRGWPVGSGSSYLRPNTSGAETTDASPYMIPTATGFAGINSGFGNTQTYIYIAIRRGPMKVPTDATKVFEPVANTTTYTSPNVIGSLNADWFFGRKITADTNWFQSSKLSPKTMPFNSTSSEDATQYVTFTNTGVKWISTWDSTATTYRSYLFQRAPSTFDVVCYTGNNNGVGQTLSHNLAAVPELMIVKRRGNVGAWLVYSTATGAANYLMLQDTAASAASSTVWQNTTPTATQFTIGQTPNQADTYVSYLFATCAGVQYINSYVGDGTTGRTINCGFTGGARFVCIKATSTTGSWWTFDSARGIVTNNDPALQLNSTAAEITSADAIDTASSGFIVNQEATCSLNASGVTYLVWAIA